MFFLPQIVPDFFLSLVIILKLKLMSHETYQFLLYAMSVAGVLVFVALYFVKAGYGMFRTASWGVSLPNKLAWMLMEVPAFIVMLYGWVRSGMVLSAPQTVFALLFLLHYFQRSFVFPLLMRGKSRMPLAIVAMGIVFNVLNGILLTTSLFRYPPAGLYADGSDFWMHSLPWIGLALFVLGMGINLHSDYVIRHLRKPGDTKHYLPQKGFYRYVTSANYLGELIEWIGFALLTGSPAAWVFVWWTAANLMPRADAIYKRYREEFGDEAVGSRKRIIPYIY